MSGVRPDIDLGGLARPASTTSIERPRRSPLRWILPLAILVVFGGVLVASLTELGRGATRVTVVRPRSSQALGGAPGTGTASVTLQAAGWVEPDPFPTLVTALAPGVVRELLVQESAVVQAGDPLARLVDDDARIEVQRIEAQLARARADEQRAQSLTELAQQSFEAALGVEEALATTRAEVEGAEAARDARFAGLKEAQARVSVATEELEVQRELERAGAAGPRQVQLAEARVAEARASLGSLQSEAALGAAEFEAAQARAQRALAEHRFRFDDRRELAQARGELGAQTAEVAGIEAELAAARLRLERMTVRAPIGGVVLERLVPAGATLEGERAALFSLYDPASLRIRVDVPQGDLVQVRIGQRAEILSEARPEKPFAGEVLRIVQRADIQKVTLQVHVRVVDGEGLLRPEMLTQVRFLGDGPTAGAADSGSLGESVQVPLRLVVDRQSIWIVDGERGTARLRPIELGVEHGEWIEVRAGLTQSDKLIDRGREDLREGARVDIEGGP